MSRNLQGPGRFVVLFAEPAGNFVTFRDIANEIHVRGGKKSGSAKFFAESKSAMSELYVAKNPK